jgi:hypothetical protein
MAEAPIGLLPARDKAALEGPGRGRGVLEQLQNDDIKK